MEKNKFTHGSLFSGIGGPEMLPRNGLENMFHCEINPFGRKILDYWFPNSKVMKTSRKQILQSGVEKSMSSPEVSPSQSAGRKGAEDDHTSGGNATSDNGRFSPIGLLVKNVAGILSMVQPGSETALG